MNCTNLNRVGIESISVGGKNHLSLLQIHKKILQDQLSMLASRIAKCYAAQSRSLENMADSGKMRFVHQQKVGYFPCTVRKYQRSGSLPKCTACSYDSISFILNPTSTKYPNRKESEWVQRLSSQNKPTFSFHNAFLKCSWRLFSCDSK